MIPQRQLNRLAILHAFYHFLNHPVRQGQAEYIGHRTAGLRGRRWEVSQRQPRLWNNEGRHFEVGLPENRGNRKVRGPNSSVFWLAAKSRLQCDDQRSLDIKAVAASICLGKWKSWVILGGRVVASAHKESQHEDSQQEEVPVVVNGEENCRRYERGGSLFEHQEGEAFLLSQRRFG